MLSSSIFRRLVPSSCAVPLLLGCAGASSRAPAAIPAVPPMDSTTRRVTPAPPFTPSMVALGDAIYHGRVGSALCYVCHGQSAHGTPKGPSLTDTTWLHGDGSYESIVAIITAGVWESTVHRNPMLPGGGTEPNREQVRALAAYVYSLSHPVR